MHKDQTVCISVSNASKSYPLLRSPVQRLAYGLGLIEKLPRALRPEITFHWAARNLSFEVRKGERVGIVGRNGAGKTTLLKMIAHNTLPTSGSITIKGEVQSLLKTGVGFNPEFSGRENIRTSLRYNNLQESQINDLYHDIVEFCDLGEHLDQPFRTYSSGMASRLQFATATAIKPDILVIDEILGAGDRYFMQKSAERMHLLAHSGCTLLLVSHATQQILHFCERAIWIEAGEIVMDGPALDVTNAYDVFLERRTREHQRGLLPSQYGKIAQHTNSSTKESTQTRDLMTSVLDDGKKVYRWPSEDGIKISALHLSDGSEERNTFVPGDNIVIDLELTADFEAEFSCRYLITFWSPLGYRVARFENDRDTFSLKAGEKHKVRFEVADQPLTYGTYFLSFSIYDNPVGLPASISPNYRFDMLAHALELKISNPVKLDCEFLVEHPIELEISGEKKAKSQISPPI